MSELFVNLSENHASAFLCLALALAVAFIFTILVDAVKRRRNLARLMSRYAPPEDRHLKLKRRQN